MRNVLNYPQDVTVLYCPNRALDSQTAGLHVVPNISKTTTAGRPFKLSHQLLLWIQETETTSNFKVKL